MKGINTNKKVTAVIYAVMIMLVTTTVAIGVYDFNIKTGTVTVDNKSQEVKTKKSTVGEVLEEEEITLDDNDYINVPKNEEIEKEFNIKIRKAVPVEINFKGKKSNIKTSDITVADVLKSQSMDYDKDYKIIPSLKTKVQKDMKITVTRYKEKINVIEEEIEFKTQTKENAQLEKGKKLTVQEGQKGLKENVVKDTYKNGYRIDKEITESKVVKEPVDEIIQIGTKVEEVKVASRAATDKTLVKKSAEAASTPEKKEVAKEETPVAPAPEKKEVAKEETPVVPAPEKKEVAKEETPVAPAPEKKEVAKEETPVAPVPEKKEVVKEKAPVKSATSSKPSLEGARSMVMKASAYDLSFESCGKRPGDKYYGITASGTHAKPGTVAVDPRVIPLGTKLYIESMDGTGSYGYATAEDKGGAIKGNRIDLFYANRSEALQFGRREVKVYILD